MLDGMIAELGTGKPIPSVRDRLGKADGLERNAHAFCAASDARHARKSLKGAFKKLGALRKLLKSKAASTVPGRDALLAIVEGVRLDVRTLKGSISCPAAATTP
jgi:hypothetical protein